MFRTVLAVSLSLLALTVNAQEYVNVSIEGKIQEVPRDYLLSTQAKVRGMGESLSACTELNSGFENILISRSNSVSIRPSSTGCSLTYRRYGVWQYNCTLDSKTRKRLGTEWIEQSDSDRFLGAWSPVEESIILNSKYCTERRL